MIARSLLTTDLDSRGGLRLTEDARPVLKGLEQVDFRVEKKPQKQKKTRSSRGGVSKDDEALWNKLREVRSALAKEQKVPAYVIFHDATLMEMMERRPASMTAMSAVSGVGVTKLEKYGQTFLDALNSDTDTTNAPASSTKLEKTRLLELISGNEMQIEDAISMLEVPHAQCVHALVSLVRSGDVDIAEALSFIGVQLTEHEREQVESEVLCLEDGSLAELKALQGQLDGEFTLDALRCIHAGIELELEVSG